MLRRFVVGFAAMVATLILFAMPASAQQRIALVIGNAAYAKGPLKTSLADGGLVAEALTSIGFEIVEGADVNQADLRRLVRDFLAKVQDAGPNAIAFVYYSGYGLQFEGDNYLVPVDARLERDSDIPIDAVRLFDILRPLADMQAAAKVVILDASRPLPFQIQGGKLARGLGAIESAPGMIVGFSAAPGNVAPDGNGPYGAYATAIAEMVREPGLDLDNMFARIRIRTVEATGGAQVPWNVSQEINPQIMLVPGPPSAPPRVARTAPRPMRDVGVERAYALAIEDDTLEGYTEFVRVYPNSPYSNRVWALIRDRREALAWRRALLMNTPDAYWTYLSRYPDGVYAYDAERRLRRLSAGLRPPPGFRGVEFYDVPPPLAGEPARFIDVYPDAPPPPRILGAPPAFIVGLPPPRRPGGGPGLWRRPDNPFPVIVNPGANFGPSGPGQFQKKGPTIVNQPPNLPPSGGPQQGFQGPPPGWAKPGTGIPGPTGPGPGGSGPQFQKKGPGIATTPPGGAGPGGAGNPQLQKKGPTIVNQPPNLPSGSGPQQGFQGPPPGWAKPGTGITTNPPPVKQVNPPPNLPPAVTKQTNNPALKQVNPPTPPQPPQVKQVNPPPGPQPGFSGPPAGWAKPGTGIPAQGAKGPQGQKKCVVVNGQQVCQ